MCAVLCVRFLRLGGVVDARFSSIVVAAFFLRNCGAVKKLQAVWHFFWYVSDYVRYVLRDSTGRQQY